MRTAANAARIRWITMLSCCRLLSRRLLGSHASVPQNPHCGLLQRGMRNKAGARLWAEGGERRDGGPRPYTLKGWGTW